MSRSFHVFPRSDGKWSVRATGAERASRTFDTQKEATSYALTTVKDRSGELYVHDKDGCVRGRYSYSADRVSVKG